MILLASGTPAPISVSSLASETDTQLLNDDGTESNCYSPRVGLGAKFMCLNRTSRHENITCDIPCEVHCPVVVVLRMNVKNATARMRNRINTTYRMEELIRMDVK